MARLHRKVANIRKDALHKLTTYLAKNHGTIVIEDLNVSGMLSNHKLAKSIAYQGFYGFRRQLEYKCQWYGSELVVVDRFFPSSKTCCRCGHVQDMPLNLRRYDCPDCGLSIDRDLNASINLRSGGRLDRECLWTECCRQFRWKAVRPRVGVRRKRCDPATTKVARERAPREGMLTKRQEVNSRISCYMTFYIDFMKQLSL
ncbi:RNA-guided endonuclease InsQ/TnpB family protein [Hydrocoleum sp. CS-953]|uniref:RNA-guided endonuclease InsQ/TnpB family protein n=1 Tax=Hydrocoleum sp. CS-953 TaxID=1671698 RepID=UPI00352B1872